MAGLTSFCSPGTAATAPACSQRCSELRLPGAQTTAAVLQGAAAARYQLGPSSIDKLRVRARGETGEGAAQAGPGWPKYKDILLLVPSSGPGRAGTGYWQKLLEEKNIKNFLAITNHLLLLVISILHSTHH